MTLEKLLQSHLPPTEQYYVANPENKRVMYGPFQSREQADAVWHHICVNGIPDETSGSVFRPRAIVIHEAALEVTDNGSHFRDCRGGET